MTVPNQNQVRALDLVKYRFLLRFQLLGVSTDVDFGFVWTPPLVHFVLTVPSFEHAEQQSDYLRQLYSFIARLDDVETLLLARIAKYRQRCVSHSGDDFSAAAIDVVSLRMLIVQRSNTSNDRTWSPRGFNIQANFHGNPLDLAQVRPWGLSVDSREFIDQDEEWDPLNPNSTALKPTSDAVSKSKQALYLRIK
jgi:hypothetical protein